MSTPTLLACAIATVAWFLLLISGIKRGHRRQITVFNSPNDCAYTALLILAVGVSCLPVNLPLPVTHFWKLCTIVGTCFWLRAAHRTNPRSCDLGLAVLTKVSLVVIAGLCLAIVITSAARVFAPKSSPVRQIVNAVAIGVGLFACYRYVRMISQLIPGARPLKPVPPKLSVWEKLMTST